MAAHVNSTAETPAAGRHQPFTRLRPRDIGSLFDQAVILYRHNFMTWVGIVALIEVPVSIVLTLATVTLLDPTTLARTPRLPGPGAGSDAYAGYQAASVAALSDLLSRAFLVTAVTIVGAILLNIASGALARVIAENYMGGTMGVAAAYRAIRPRIPALIGVMLIIMLSAVLAFIPPLFLWIYISLSFVSQVIVLENRGVGDALQRSWELVRGSWWRVFGAYLLLLLVGMIVNLSTTVISLAVGLTGASWAVQNIAVQFVTLLLTVVYRPISLAGMTLLYFDLRIRKEGYDLQVALDARAREMGLAAAPAGAAWPYRETAPAAPAASTEASPAGWPYGEATQA
jgi:hypothetical protein